MQAAHPRLDALVARARAEAGADKVAIGIVHPGDAVAMQAARRIADEGVARPVLIGSPDVIARAAAAAGIDVSRFEIVASHGDDPRAAAERAVELARSGGVGALMKGSLHTDELMAPVIRNHTGLRGERRISHAFVFDAPRLPKLLALADCVVNIAPDLRTKRDIVFNACALLRGALGIPRPMVAIVAAIETVNPQIPATIDAAALVEEARQGAFGDAVVEGPFGFDNAVSADAARTKGLDSQVAGQPDLLIVPDLNAGNLLYKSFVYVGGAECAGVVLGTTVPIVLTSRADSLAARVASVALAGLMARARGRA